MPTPSNPGVIPSLSVAGRVLTDIPNLKILYGSLSNSATANKCSPRVKGGTTGYQVPVGKTFRIVAIEVYGNIITTAADTFALSSCDNDCGVQSNTSPTNPVYPGGSSVLSYPNGTAAANCSVTNYDYDIPATKYIGLVSTNSANSLTTRIYGYEF